MRAKAKALLSRVITPQGPLWMALKRSFSFTTGLYRTTTKNSIFFEEEELPMCSLQHPRKLDKTLKLFQPRSVLDVGCGTGWSLAYLHDRGIDVFGIEGSPLAISKARHPERMRQHNLNQELDLHRRFDLIWCVEVVEHIHPQYVHNLLETFSNHSGRIVMSAAQPGQGGEGHFNEQPPAYWISKLAERGYALDEEATAALQGVPEHFSANMLVFRR